MSERTGNYRIPAGDEAAAQRLARKLRQDFAAVFGRVKMPKDVYRAARAVLEGRVDDPANILRATKEIPQIGWPDAKAYDYRIHGVRMWVDTGLETDDAGQEFFRAQWHFESRYVYHADIDGEHVSGLLSDIFAAREKKRGRATA